MKLWFRFLALVFRLKAWCSSGCTRHCYNLNLC
jgi:hypothetical protein